MRSCFAASRFRSRRRQSVSGTKRLSLRTMRRFSLARRPRAQAWIAVAARSRTRFSRASSRTAPRRVATRPQASFSRIARDTSSLAFSRSRAAASSMSAICRARRRSRTASSGRPPPPDRGRFARGFGAAASMSVSLDRRRRWLRVLRSFRPGERTAASSMARAFR